MSMRPEERERRAAVGQEIEPPAERSVMDNIKLGSGLALMAALALFFAQNWDKTDINFLWLDWNSPLVFALLASAAVGAIASWLFTTLRGRAARKLQDELYQSAMRGARR
jgi:uncharacterized integral membrane protein